MRPVRGSGLRGISQAVDPTAFALLAEPILIVGDDRGGVNCMKLSPNLRRIDPLTPAANRGPPTRRYVEVAKMDKVLAPSVS